MRLPGVRGSMRTLLMVPLLVLAAFPLAAAEAAGPEALPLDDAAYPCVWLDEWTHVCYYTGDDGACVGGIWGHYPYEVCSGRIQTESTAYPCVYMAENFYVCYDTNSQGDPCVRVVFSYSSYYRCFPLRAVGE